MTYRDIIREMESRGDCSEAERFERGLERNGYSEWDHVYRGNEADGMAHTYEGDCAEKAAEEIRYRERREEERRQEEEQEREAAYRHRLEQERLEEEAFYERQQQEPYPEQPEPQQP